MLNLKKTASILFCIHLAFIAVFGAAASAASPAEADSWYINGRPAPTRPEGSWQGQDIKKITACESRPGYQRLTDYPQGYSVCIPAGLAPDFSLSAVRNTFTNPTTQIEIYHDDFSSFRD